jgi:hypothetical protein
MCVYIYIYMFKTRGEFQNIQESNIFCKLSDNTRELKNHKLQQSHWNRMIAQVSGAVVFHQGATV